MRPRTIRCFLLLEFAAFLAAALVHSGHLIAGYEHPRARIAEAVIASVLLAGLVGSWVRPTSTRGSGLAAQGFAMVGTLVGAFTILIGVGPQTVPDIAYHVALIIVLSWGVIVTWRASLPPAPRR